VRPTTLNRFGVLRGPQRYNDVRRARLSQSLSHTAPLRNRGVGNHTFRFQWLGSLPDVLPSVFCDFCLEWYLNDRSQNGVLFTASGPGCRRYANRSLKSPVSSICMRR
jgi:hypothetical protein